MHKPDNHTSDKKHIHRMSLLLYDLLSGNMEFDEEAKVSPSLKRDRQKCDALTDEIFGIKQKLEPSLPYDSHRNELGECLLLERLIDTIEELTRSVCERAFNYGVAYGSRGALPKPMPDILKGKIE